MLSTKSCPIAIPNFLKILLLTILFLSPFCEAFAERVFFAGYKGGFYIRSEEQGGMELKAIIVSIILAGALFLLGATSAQCAYHHEGETENPQGIFRME